jgi:hypothetical protein
MTIPFIYLDNHSPVMTLSQEPLRKCNWCGLEAHTETELPLFTKSRRHKYGYRNICKTCFSKALREGKYAESHALTCHNWYINHRGERKARITFKVGDHEFKRLYVDGEPRQGTCSECGIVGQTHLHHDSYDPNDPLKDTRELCVSCHTKHHNNERQQEARV